MKEILSSKRLVTSNWHREQSKTLLDFAIKNDSANALIYAILESRIALERYVFEMSVLTKGEDSIDKIVKLAAKKNGVFRLLEKTTVNYIKHISFCNIIFEINKLPLNIDTPNLKIFKQLITELSKYCHPQYIPDESVDSENKEWFIKGVALVNKTVEMLRSLVFNGGININSMEADVREIYDKYINGDITKETVRFRLNIMGPIIKLRQLKSITKHNSN